MSLDFLSFFLFFSFSWSVAILFDNPDQFSSFPSRREGSRSLEKSTTPSNKFDCSIPHTFFFNKEDLNHACGLSSTTFPQALLHNTFLLLFVSKKPIVGSG